MIITKSLMIVSLFLLQSTIASTGSVYLQANNVKPSKRTYTIGYIRNLFNDVDINDARAALKIWTSEILDSYHFSNNYSLKAKIYNNFDEFKEQMKADNVAVIIMSTYNYFQDINKIELEPKLVPSVNSQIGVEYCLLVRKSDNYNNIISLKNARIGLTTKPADIASEIWLDVTLAKDRLPSKEKYFKSVTKIERESQLILNLFFGQLDACLVSKNAFNLMSELNPQINIKLKSILTSPSYLQGISCFTKNFTNEYDRNIYLTKAINVHTTPSGKQIFSLLKIDKLVPYKDEYLTNFKILLNDYNKYFKK